MVASLSYQEFLQKKAPRAVPTGILLSEIPELNPRLLPYQRDVVLWALQRGRAALFEDCGLGKSFQQLEWARVVSEYAGGDVLILAPLAVAGQTVAEAQKFGISAHLCTSDVDVRPGINVTNYEKLHNFQPKRFVGVVLDESSILKSFTGSTRTELIQAFAKTPYRLAATATPAPNDHMELGNHAQFLGVMNVSEMLARFFVHDGGETQKWRLKRHAEDLFWEWVSSWACLIRRPSDLGYPDDGFVLPPLKTYSVSVDTGPAAEIMSLRERQTARRETISARVERTVDYVDSDDDQWIVWCDLNAESAALAAAIEGAVEIVGSDKPHVKERRLLDFAAGKIRVLVTKPSIAGFGMNFQNCHKMAFVGLSDSFEMLYQAIRRCWRYGQAHPVECYLVTSSREGAVVANIRRKEADAERMAQSMAQYSKRVLAPVTGLARERDKYE